MGSGEWGDTRKTALRMIVLIRDSILRNKAKCKATNCQRTGYRSRLLSKNRAVHYNSSQQYAENPRKADFGIGEVFP